MIIEKSKVNIGWWVVKCRINGIDFSKYGENKLNIIDELFEQIKWTLSIN